MTINEFNNLKIEVLQITEPVKLLQKVRELYQLKTPDGDNLALMGLQKYYAMKRAEQKEVRREQQPASR